MDNAVATPAVPAAPPVAARPKAESPLRYPIEPPPSDGTLVEIAPGLMWARIPMPMSLDHINCYLLRDRYGIGQADALIRTGAARHVLVIGAEKLSDFVSPTDRSISFLLGDGAGAAIVGPSETPRIGPTVWGSDGDNWRFRALPSTPKLTPEFQRAAPNGAPLLA